MGVVQRCDCTDQCAYVRLLAPHTASAPVGEGHRWGLRTCGGSEAAAHVVCGGAGSFFFESDKINQPDSTTIKISSHTSHDDFSLVASA